MNPGDIQAGDVNGDGVSDLIIRSATNRQSFNIYLGQPPSSNSRAAEFGLGTTLPNYKQTVVWEGLTNDQARFIFGDFDANGVVDMAVFNPQSKGSIQISYGEIKPNGLYWIDARPSTFQYLGTDYAGQMFMSLAKPAPTSNP